MSESGDSTSLPRKTWVWRGIMGVTHALTRTLYPTRVQGVEHVPLTGGALIVANHQSVLDIPLIARAAHRRHLTFVARSTLAGSRVLAFILDRCQAILIDRDRGDRVALTSMIERLEAGALVVIFPEGKRSRDGELGIPKKGALLAARRAGVPIVPCAVDGSFRAMPPGARFPRPTRIRVSFGGPVSSADRDALQHTWGEISSLLGQPEPELTTAGN